MGKPSRAKRPFKIGKGQVTPTQVAFMVDRYLLKNKFFETRSSFRNEASSLLSNSPVSKVPKSLIPLDDILNEYICLKEEKIVIDQERLRLDQENIRVQNLLQGMQNVVETYNSSLITPPPVEAPSSNITPLPPVVAPSSHFINCGLTSSGCGQYSTPSVMPVALLGNQRVESENISTPFGGQAAMTGKRKGPEVSVVAPPVSRKPRTTNEQEKSTANEANKMSQDANGANILSSQTQNLAKNCATDEFLIGDMPSLVKCLFNQADRSIPDNSTWTPLKHASSHATDECNNLQNELEVTPANYTNVTKERFTISPLKQITSYSVERSQVISPSVQSNQRDHVGGKLNSDDTDTENSLESFATAPLVATSPSGYDPEVDLFDMAFSDMDFSGETFELLELLDDFDLDSLHP